MGIFFLLVIFATNCGALTTCPTLFSSPNINSPNPPFFCPQVQMAKYRRYRKYTRRSRGRWSSNIKNINKVANYSISADELSQGGTLWFSDLLTENPAQTDNSVSQTYTVKNFDFSFYIDSYIAASQINQATLLDNFSCYIIFVPQGFTLSPDVIRTHPEWIMAMRFIGQPKADSEQQQFLPFRIKTRMARRLNTGDAIHFLAIGTRDPFTYTLGTALNLQCKGLVRWWTKAN